MKASFCASIVACTALLASGSSLQAQYDVVEAPFAGPGYDVGHSQPAYPPVGGYLLPEYSAEELLWFRGEYLLWWFKDADIPPLVTTGSPADTVPGALGQPGTRVLFGDEIDHDSFNGARFTIGGWFDAHRTFGAEVNWFLFDRGTEEFAAASSGASFLTRPFFDVSTGTATPSVARLGIPGVSSGRIDIESSSRLLGFEINGLCDPWYDQPYESPNGDVDLIYGFRYLDLEEDLGIGDWMTFFAGSGLPEATTLATSDVFDTRNRFYGGQAGLQWQARRGPVAVRVLGKVALGATHQNVRVAGQSFLRIPSIPPLVLTEGELAQQSNIGEYNRDRFSVVPEIGAFIGYDVLEGLSIFAGYSFVYWTNVVRPGDQIDTASGLAPGSSQPRPVFDFHETDFWAHGLSFGASLTF